MVGLTHFCKTLAHVSHNAASRNVRQVACTKSRNASATIWMHLDLWFGIYQHMFLI